MAEIKGEREACKKDQNTNEDGRRKESESLKGLEGQGGKVTKDREKTGISFRNFTGQIVVMGSGILQDF